MIFYGERNVYEAAKDRIKFVFNEFPRHRISVSFSGGKDSTVILHITKEVMDELGIHERLPVFFLDQELEAPQVIDYMRNVMSLPWVEPFWVQSHFKEFNSSEGDWFDVWEPGVKWAREKEPNSYKDIIPSHMHDFPKVMQSFQLQLFGDRSVAFGGLHMDESPTRRNTLLFAPFYKDVTWGKSQGRQSYVFYPLYDWNVYDIWYYIFSNRLPYCSLYNYYFTRKPLQRCRVSSFIHENSIQSLAEIKEISPYFYEACLRRVRNVNTTVQTYSNLSQYVNELPAYFKDWDEYVTYCADHICAKEENRNAFLNKYHYFMRHYVADIDDVQFKEEIESYIGKAAMQCLLAEDYRCSKLTNCTIDIYKKKKRYEERITRHTEGGVARL